MQNWAKIVPGLQIWKIKPPTNKDMGFSNLIQQSPVPVYNILESALKK